MSVDLATIQTELVHLLNAGPYFADITVLYERSKDLENELDRQLAGATLKAGKHGAFVIVGTFEADVESPDVTGPYFGALRLNIMAYEDVLMNTGPTGTGKSAIDIAIAVAQHIQDYRPEGIAESLYCDRSTIRPHTPPDNNQVAYRVSVRIPANIAADPRVATPVITPGDATVPQELTITSATSGAAIYYTTDESYPWSGNTAATLYAAPFTVTEAASVRAAAQKTAMLPSSSALALLT